MYVEKQGRLEQKASKNKFCPYHKDREQATAWNDMIIYVTVL